jgi:tRNA dimethylallyltransferase
MTVVAIFGPTASGKTPAAEEVARRVPAELISADAMQVYRGLPILTNQSTRTTRLVGIWPLAHEGSVGEYQRLAHAAIDEALACRRLAVVVGGTGLYLRAALADLAVPPAPPPGLRTRLEALYDRVGGARMHELLAARDPAAAQGVHPNDRRRVVRAIELAELGTSLRPNQGGLWTDDVRHPTIVFGLVVPPAELERRIRERTEAMFEAGAADEARRALTGAISRTARQVHGLREAADLPRGEAVEAIVATTRRYAAYQRKWMRRIPGLVTVQADRPAGEVADEIVQVVRARQHLPARRIG